MNIIEWLTHYPPFIAEVAAKVEVELKGTSISAGRFSGLIDDVTLTAPLDFEPGECFRSTCAVAFSSRCKVSGTGKDDQGAMASITKDGSLFGYVDVAYPEGAADAVPFESIYQQIERDVRVEETGFELE